MLPGVPRSAAEGMLRRGSYRLYQCLKALITWCIRHSQHQTDRVLVQNGVTRPLRLETTGSLTVRVVTMSVGDQRQEATQQGIGSSGKESDCAVTPRGLCCPGKAATFDFSKGIEVVCTGGVWWLPL